MTYLTQMRLNPARRGAARLFQSPQAMHAAVLAAYSVDDPGRVLWRLDVGSRHQATLYVVGPLEPDLTHLVEQAGWPTTESWRTTSYEPFLSRLDDGQRWRFRLTANPVRVLPPTQRGVRGKVVPHVTVTHQQGWLRERAKSWGFEPLPEVEGGAVVTSRGRDRFGKREGEVESRRQVTVERVRFDGVLNVTDVVLLRDALAAGMGRAKAYGCGLMTLAPVR